MPEGDRTSGGRSGCALFMGVLLVALGVLFLAHNFFDLSLLRFLRSAAELFADYWPVLLIVWGGLKIFQRFAKPERARVTAFEMFLFLFVVGAGLTLRATRRVMEEFATDASLEEIFGFEGLSILSGPAQSFTEEQSFDFGSSLGLDVTNPGGTVRVSGWDGAEARVVLTKKVRHLSAGEASRSAESIDLRFDAGSERARLEVVVPRGRGMVETDLDIHLPRDKAVKIKNRRGLVEVSDLSGRVEVETSHERIEASTLEGGLLARARYADIRVQHVTGNVELYNRDGSITARNIDGDFRAETSHAAILAEDVAGRAHLANRHGSVQASRVGGDLEVAAQHTEVSVESARGAVVVATTHRPIFIRDVGGKLHIDARNATLQARDLRGDVVVDDPDGDVSITGVKGRLQVRTPQAKVTAEQIDGPALVESSHDDVTVMDFGSSLTVRSSHAEVRAETARLGGGIRIETTYGDVELAVPAEAPIRFEGRTRDGELSSGLGGLELSEGAAEGARRWTGSRAPASLEVTIDTTYGDIVLRPKAP